MSKLLTRKEVAARLGIATRTLDAWRAAGQFPEPIKLNQRCLRWPESIIEAFLKGKLKS